MDVFGGFLISYVVPFIVCYCLLDTGYDMVKLSMILQFNQVSTYVLYISWNHLIIIIIIINHISQITSTSI